MNTTDILDKALSWLCYSEQEELISSRLLSYFMRPTGGATQLHLGSQDWFVSGYYNLFGQEKENNSPTINGIFSGQQIVTPQEVEDFIQIILHTLDSEPDRFHDMAEIPGLEAQDYIHRMELARYLLNYGLIEANFKDSKLFIKLTIRGGMYLKSHESAA